MAEAARISAVTGRLVRRRRFPVLRRLLRHGSFRTGALLVAMLVLAAVFAPLITHVDPTAMRIRYRFRPPSMEFPFGTDMFGRSVLARVVYGARLSLWIGLSVAVLSGGIGALIGVLSAQWRRLDGLFMRLMDALAAFPAIVLAIGLGAALGPASGSLIIALSMAYIPRTTRAVRGM
jgi:peptide/nickel transport system permease protein